MDALGLPERPIPMGRDRAPVWPEGVVGSISHSDAFCLAAVARSDRVWRWGWTSSPTCPWRRPCGTAS
jgi:4'-phosphopantetheinyl transferase EntD